MIIIDLCKAFWNRLLANPKKINKPIESKDLISKDAIKTIQNLTKEMQILLYTVEKLRQEAIKTIENDINK